MGIETSEYFISALFHISGCSWWFIYHDLRLWNIET